MNDHEPWALERGGISERRVMKTLETFSLPSHKDLTKSVRIFKESRKTKRFSPKDKAGIDIECMVDPEAKVLGNPRKINVQVKSNDIAVRKFKEEYVSVLGNETLTGEAALINDRLIVINGSPNNSTLEIDLVVKLNRMFRAIAYQKRQR